MANFQTEWRLEEKTPIGIDYPPGRSQDFCKLAKKSCKKKLCKKLKCDKVWCLCMDSIIEWVSTTSKMKIDIFHTDLSKSEIPKESLRNVISGVWSQVCEILKLVRKFFSVMGFYSQTEDTLRIWKKKKKKKSWQPAQSIPGFEGAGEKKLKSFKKKVSRKVRPKKLDP